MTSILKKNTCRIFCLHKIYYSCLSHAQKMRRDARYIQCQSLHSCHHVALGLGRLFLVGVSYLISCWHIRLSVFRVVIFVVVDSLPASSCCDLLFCKAFNWYSAFFHCFEGYPTCLRYGFVSCFSTRILRWYHQPVLDYHPQFKAGVTETVYNYAHVCCCQKAPQSP